MTLPVLLTGPLLALGLSTQPPAAPPAFAQEVPLPPSVIRVPIQIQLDGLFAEVERVAPKVPPGVETWMDLPGGIKGATAYRFNLYRDPLMMRMQGNRLSVRTQAHYWLEVGVKVGGYAKALGSCGLGQEGFRRVLLGVDADIAVTPQWGLAVKLTPAEPMPMNSCSMTAANVDITGKVLGGMRSALLQATGMLEGQLAQNALLRQKADLVWSQVQKPMEVAPGIFVAMQPERLRLGAWGGNGSLLTIPLEVEARPVLSLGRPAEAAQRPLPLLEPAGQGPQGFQVKVDADLTFAEATEQLRRQMKGKRFDTEKGPIEVLDIAVRGGGGKALLDLTIKGKVDGTLHLSGRPVFDEATGCLRLADLDYTLESKSWITKFGEWLFRSTIRKSLDEKGHWLMNRSLGDLKNQVQLGLNRSLMPGVALSGQLQDLKLGQPKVLADRFLVEAFLSGQVQVNLGMPK